MDEECDDDEAEGEAEKALGDDPEENLGEAVGRGFEAFGLVGCWLLNASLNFDPAISRLFILLSVLDILPVVVSSAQTNKLLCASASHTTPMASRVRPHEPPILLHSARGSSLRAILGPPSRIVKAGPPTSMAHIGFRPNPGSTSIRLLHLKARAT